MMNVKRRAPKRPRDSSTLPVTRSILYAANSGLFKEPRRALKPLLSSSQLLVRLRTGW